MAINTTGTAISFLALGLVCGQGPNTDSATFSPALAEVSNAAVHATNTSFSAESPYLFGGTVAPVLTSVERATTPIEKVIGELRRYALLSADWDGEGASAPVALSLRRAMSFACLLFGSSAIPEPTIGANGHAGLFWQTGTLYADLEFLPDDRIAYYIAAGEDKHKGVVHFDQKVVPPVFETLIQL